ncbi:AMP-binding protein [Methanolapillus millepedarum]|uniref:Acetyl-coenzyme A synthetase n=1 Tax=Methanolapillus millepedarum TaxID=3028296 RepID=A0AA96V5U5_9EURY|nr:Acetyl-coenzyme A synthetase [Methanosarcinaceae archaeon Ac7]
MSTNHETDADQGGNLVHRFVQKTKFESYEDFRDNFKINIPDDFNFAYDVVDWYAANDPKKIAIVWCDDQGGEKIFSFADLKRETDKAANLFVKHGVKKGSAVILTLKSRYEFWVCLVALHKIGAIAVPATHMLKKRDIIHRLEKSKACAIVSISESGLDLIFDEAAKEAGLSKFKKFIVGKSSAGAVDWIDYDKEMAEASDAFSRPAGKDAVTANDDMLYYFSSGTTGFPKMVAHKYAYPLGHIITAGYWQNVRNNGLHYTMADSGWAKCVWGKIYGQWIWGTAVFVYDFDEFDAKNMLEKVSKYGVTTFCAPPTIYRFFIKEDLSQYNFGTLQYCTVAGEPLNPEVYEKFLLYTGLPLMEGYGQTEIIASIATFPWISAKPGSMGKPAPGYDVVLINVDGRECDVGEEGEIVIRVNKDADKSRPSDLPPGFFAGYKYDDEKTKDSWHDGFYHTGDTAWKDEDGYYWFVGRTDDIIKSSGYKIGPFEVESALIQHPGVLECAITGVPDPVRGQVVKATIVLTKDYKNKASDALKKELQEHVKKITAPYKYPRVIEFVDVLPKTISGKIRRVEIREQDKERK